MAINFNAAEIINILVGILLFWTILRRRDVTTVLWVLFIYGSLHFSFSVFTLASDEYISLWAAHHKNGSGVIAQLTVLALLGSAYILLMKYAYDGFSRMRSNDKKIAFQIISVMIAIILGYFINMRLDDWAQLKNVISIEAILVLLLIGLLVSNSNSPQVTGVPAVYLWGGVGLLVIIDAIAIYEVVTQRSWAGTRVSPEYIVYRASSVLFNPNLLGFWAGLVYLGCAYGMHRYNRHLKIIYLCMILAVIAMYMSGSRSSVYMLLMVLLIPTLLTKKYLRWPPLLVLPVTMVAIYSMSSFFMKTLVFGREGWHGLVLLGERFAATPLYTIKYILMRMDNNVNVSAPISADVAISSGVPDKVITSIEGRLGLNGRGGDSGWLTLYHDVGWVGTAAMIWMCAIALVWAWRNYSETRSIAAIYALTVLCYCLVIGVAMRFQIFPIWLFIGVVLTPCIIVWARPDSSTALSIRQ